MNRSYEYTYPGQQQQNTRQQTLDQIVRDYADPSGNYGDGNQFSDALLQANPELRRRQDSGEIDMSHVPHGMVNIPAGYQNPRYSEEAKAFRDKYWSDPSKDYMDDESVRDVEQYKQNVRGAREARAPLQKAYQQHLETQRRAEVDRFNAMSPQERLSELQNRQRRMDDLRQPALFNNATSTIRHHKPQNQAGGFSLSLQDNYADSLEAQRKKQEGRRQAVLSTLRPGEQFSYDDTASEATNQLLSYILNSQRNASANLAQQAK